MDKLTQTGYNVAVACHALLEASAYLHRLHLMARNHPSHLVLDAYYKWAVAASDEFCEQALSLYPEAIDLAQVLDRPIIEPADDCRMYATTITKTLEYAALSFADQEPILFATLTGLLGEATGLNYQLRLAVKGI